MSEDRAKRRADAGTGRLRIATPEAGYAGNVVADLTRITGTPSGRALIRQIRAGSHSILIEKPAAGGLPNATLRPHALQAATAPDAAAGIAEASGRAAPGPGDGSDCIIAYDPRQWPNSIHPAVPSSDVLLFAMLRQALDQLRGTADLQHDAAGGTTATEAAEVAIYRREREDG